MSEPADQDKMGEEIREGMEAAQILESPVFIKSFQTLEQELLHAWQQTPVKAQEDRERLYLMTKLLQKVKINLETLVVSGKMSRQSLHQLQERQSLMPSFLRG